jgi:signal transduction histidine kinase
VRTRMHPMPNRNKADAAPKRNRRASRRTTPQAKPTSMPDAVDVPPRGVREAERQAADERASRLAYLGTLASGLAHEIRSPLGSIKLNLELLREKLDGVAPEQRAEFESRLKIIGREVDGLQELLTEFLSFARPPKMNLLATDLNELVSQVVELVEPECRERNIEIRKDFQRDLYPVALDQHQFGRGVLLNLMTNAREQIKEHGTITLRTREGEHDIEVRVEDNGGGVPPDLEERVFDLFFSTKAHGTGLGLAIARRICQEHGGELLLENHPGRGATFIVRLPKSKILEYQQ